MEINALIVLAKRWLSLVHLVLVVNYPGGIVDNGTRYNLDTLRMYEGCVLLQKRLIPKGTSGTMPSRFQRGSVTLAARRCKYPADRK